MENRVRKTMDGIGAVRVRRAVDDIGLRTRRTMDGVKIQTRRAAKIGPEPLNPFFIMLLLLDMQRRIRTDYALRYAGWRWVQYPIIAVIALFSAYSSTVGQWL